MKYRVVERPWDIERRRYAVEGLRWEVDGEQGWGIEAFFPNVLDAQLYMAQVKKGPRVISAVESG